MKGIRLRPMTDAELTERLAGLIPSYWAGHVEAGDWPPDEAEAMAARLTAELLPEGTRTAGMLLRIAETGDGDRVGLVWVAINRPRPGSADIYGIDIEIDTAHRGPGYGRALLRAAEEEARAHGSRAIALHVFGANATARRLYETSGYEVTQLNIGKHLERLTQN